MNPVLKHQFRTAIDSKKEDNFQILVNELFIKKYGNAFSPVKQKRDKGCDGILNNKTILAAYAPEKAILRNFKKKAGDDFEKYKSNWQRYSEWQYVYNGEYTSEMRNHLQSLKQDVITTDINGLLDMIEQLPHSKCRELASSLGIDEQYIVNDIMRAVIEDLLKLAENAEAIRISRNSPPYIEDKIKINYESSDVDDALKEYECVLEYFAQLEDILKSYANPEISSLKSKLINTYNKSQGNFKTRLNNLIENFSGDNSKDDSYVFFVRVVLVYFFEICVIGKRLESEK